MQKRQTQITSRPLEDLHPGMSTIRSLNRSNYGTVSRTKGMIEFNSMLPRPPNKNLISQCHDKRF